MISRSFRRLLSTAKTKSSYSLETFKERYPIAIDGSVREDSFSSQHESLEWYDKQILLPIRQKLANYTAASWINGKFKSEDGEEPYMLTTFLTGAKFAIKKFFTLLQDDINLASEKFEENGSVQTSGLKNILTSQLYNDLHFHHQEIANRGLNLDIRLNSISNIARKDIWITFGNRKYVSTTLNKADIHTSVAPLIYWRHVPGSKSFIFTELNFEYIFPSSLVPGSDKLDEDLEGPTLTPRVETTKEGAVLGVDVSFDADITVTIKPIGSEEALWVNTIRRQMLVRFETNHFIGKYDGKWKIADFDNFYASDLF